MALLAIGVFVLLSTFKSVIGGLEGFIVGGDYVESITEYPHVASLAIELSGNDYILCGSSILNQVILITAAHCLDKSEDVIASVGSVIVEQGEPYRVIKFKQHEKWKNSLHDIALCRLEKPLSLGETVKRVLLMRQPPITQTAVLTGWGAYEEIDYLESVQLKHSIQKVWTYKTCKKVVKTAPNGTICGGPGDELKDQGNFASRGDSGSGLIVNSNIIIGLVSFKNLKYSRSIVVYTDVAYYYDWIVRESKRLLCQKKIVKRS
ncbi:hypodermin-B-like [Cydia strobilella]|uniref:hypodermin-B-like n=1 Tax=Cydia strobilella TaxID=1100964 RepID=UPI0030061AF6